MYKKQMEGRPTVSSQRFLELWLVLFPRHRKRPFCNIPGKCSVCYEIDRQRRQENTTHVHRMLKDAHLLHRAGMFHLEREE